MTAGNRTPAFLGCGHERQRTGMKRLLIISSEHTGHGHKSIAQALVDQFETYGGEFHVKVVNGFELNGPLGTFIERRYKFTVTYLRPVWNILYYLFGKFAHTQNKLTAFTMKKRFMELLQSYRPDAIISVHPGYTGSVVRVMEKYDVKLPLYIILADLVDLARLWAEPKAEVTICPTEESAQAMRKMGVPEEKLWLSGFPVRRAFATPIKSEEELRRVTLNKRELSILIINNSEKIKRIAYITDTMLQRYPCSVTVICARDELMYKFLKARYKGREERVTVLGYTTNMQDYLLSHDIAVTRCGPNTMLEAVNCLTPIVSMGALPGQERDNPLYMEKHNLGLQTADTDDIFKKIDELLKDNRKKLLEIRLSQFRYYGRNASEKIAAYLAERIRNQPPVPSKEKQLVK